MDSGDVFSMVAGLLLLDDAGTSASNEPQAMQDRFFTIEIDMKHHKLSI
jgi:hypothetical protein